MKVWYQASKYTLFPAFPYEDGKINAFSDMQSWKAWKSHPLLNGDTENYSTMVWCHCIHTILQQCDSALTHIDGTLWQNITSNCEVHLT